MNTALWLKNVEKRYGRRTALDGLTLSVPPGSAFGLVGSNGAGKTTALAVIMGLLRIRRGEINLLGRGPFDPKVHGGRVSLLPQDAQLPGHARVGEILQFYGRLQGIDPSRLAHETDTWLDRVNLLDRARDKIRALSHGMRKRLAVAQALLGEPEMILLDEPLNGLDPVETANLRGLLAGRAAGQTLIISSHLLSELEATCDHVAIIEKGRTLRQAPIQEYRESETRIVYRVRTGNIPLEHLQAEVPDVQFESAGNKPEFVAVLPPSGVLAEEVNAAVAACLSRHGPGLLEIQLGNNLESAYLKSRNTS